MRRTLLGNAALAAVHAATAWTSLRLFATLHASASPVWPATGVAVAALLLWGLRFWPGVFVGALVANVLVLGPVWPAVAIAGGNALEAVAAAALVGRCAGGARAFERARDVVRYVLCAGLVAPMVGATVGVTAVALGGMLPWSGYAPVWATWWLGDASGAVVVAPLLVLAVRSWRGLGALRPSAEAAGLAVAAVAGAGIVFSPLVVRMPHAPLSFALVPLSVWAGIRFGSLAAAAISFLVAAVATWGTLAGHGPFAAESMNTALLFLQLFVIVLATTGLALGAVVRERRDAEASAREAQAAERRFHEMVESAPDAVVIADREGRIRLVNARTQAMFGYTREELLALRIEDLMPPRFRAHHLEHRRAYHEAPRQRPMGMGRELYALRKDGTEFPVEISLSPLVTDRGFLVSSSIRDISQRKEAEAELEASRRQLAMSEKLAALGTMVSGVGHEVRTPLTFIGTNLALIKIQMDRLAAGQDPAAVAEQVRRLTDKSREGVQRIDRIVQQLRQFAKAQLRTEAAALHEVVANAAELFRSVHKGEVFLRADLEEMEGFEVDKGQVQQVLINLLNNGAEAMGNRGTLRLRLRRVQDGAEIEVSDEGPGIPPDLHGRLFDPFFTTKPDGTGLGLPISRRIVESHGGTLGFRTGPTGTTFVVSLPRRPPAPAALVEGNGARDARNRLAADGDGGVGASVGASGDGAGGNVGASGDDGADDGRGTGGSERGGNGTAYGGQEPARSAGRPPGQRRPEPRRDPRAEVDG